MSKPFPCCCQCVDCGDFGPFAWKGLYCGLSQGSAVFVSSSTGRRLHEDLMRIGQFNIPELTEIRVGNLLRGAWMMNLPGATGNTYTYTVSGVSYFMTIGQFEIQIEDRCGFIRIQNAILRFTYSTPVALSGFIDFYNTNTSGSPNCGQTYQSNIVDGINTVGIINLSGAFYARYDDGTVMTCPLSSASVNNSFVGSSLVS